MPTFPFRIFTSLLLLFISSIGNAQISVADSLKQEYDNGTLSKYQLYDNLFWEYLNVNKDSAKVYSTLVTQTASSEKEILNAKNINGTYYMTQKNYPIAFKNFSEILEHKNSDEILKGSACNNLGVMYLEKGKLDSSRIFYTKGLNYRIKGNDTKEKILESHVNLGSLEIMTSKYKKALESLFNSLSIAKDLKLEKRTAIILYNIGLTYSFLNENKNAIKYYQQSVEILKKLNLNRYVVQANNSIAEIYTRNKEYKKAEKILYQNLEMNIDDRNNASAYYLLADILFYQQKFKKSIDLANAALKLDTKLDNKKEIADDKILLAKSYYELNNLNKAKHLLTESKEFFEEVKDTVTLLTNYSLLTRINILENKDNHREKHLTNFLKLQDYQSEFYKNEKFKSIFELDKKYQTKEKELEILKLSNENEKQKASIAKSRLWLSSSIGISSLLGLLGFFLWQRRKQQQKLQLLEKSIEATDMEKNRIGRELHDGVASKVLQLINSSEDAYHSNTTNKLNDIYTEIRNLSHQLNNTPAHAEEPLFERIIELTSTINTPKVNLTIKPMSLIVKEPDASHIYRIIQELLVNTIKHAQSTTVDISINGSDNLTITYQDNGIGLADDLKKGNGLKNIEHRVQVLMGTINYNNTEHINGFSVNISIPQE